MVLVLCTLGLAPSAMAGQSARVLLVHPDGGTPLLNEAVIRTRAELIAVGFEVSVVAARQLDSQEEPSNYGSLELRMTQRAKVRIHAMSPDQAFEYTQLLDIAPAEVDAEVIAIRAVEALRATMAQYARERRARDKPVPDAVEDFARLEPTALPKERQPPGNERESSLSPSNGEEDATRPVPITAVLLAGPAVTLPSPSLPAAWAGRLGVLARGRRFQLGVSVETLLTASTVSSPGGQADVTRDLAVMHIGWRSPISKELEWTLRAGAGVARYSVKGIPEDGFTGNTEHLVSPLGQVSLGVENWLHQNYGWYIDGLANVMGNAPEPRIGGEDVALIGRPELTISLGLLLGQRE